MNLWSLLSRLNKWLLPSIHKAPDLTRLNAIQKAVVGWKMYVTYRHLDHLQKNKETPLDGERLLH